MNHKWSLLGVDKFYTAEEALTLLRNMSDFEDECTSESEIEGDSSDSSEYAPEQNIRSEPIQIFKHYCLKKQLIRMPQNVHYWLMKQPPHQVREHVALPPKLSKVKEISIKGQKAAPKLVAKKRVIPQKTSALCDEGSHGIG